MSGEYGFTPGPWAVETHHADRYDGWYWTVDSEAGDQVAECDNKEDAQAIALLPNLVAALGRVLEAVNTLRAVVHHDDGRRQEYVLATESAALLLSRLRPSGKEGA